MTVAEVAPAAPSIAWALLVLSSAVAFIVSWGLLHGWNRTIGALFAWLGGLSIHVPFAGTIRPFNFANTINNNVKSYLGQAVAATEHAMVYSFHRLVSTVVWTAQSISGLATDVYNAIHGTSTRLIHTVTRVADAKLGAAVRRLTATIGSIEHATIPALRRDVAALAHRVTALAHSAGHAIANPFPRIGQLEREIKSEGKRLTRLEKRIGSGVGIALLTAALGGALVNFLRCPGINRALRGRTCVNESWLSDLLDGGLLIAGTLSFVEFVKLAQALEAEALDAMSTFVREL